MTMTPDELRAAVTVVDGRLDLDLAGLPTGGAAVFLGRFLGQGRLVLRDAVRTETPGGVDVAGTGDAAPFTGMTVTATLTADDAGTVAVVLDARGDEQWSFARGFPVLAGGLFDGVAFQRPVLRVDSTAVAAAEAAEAGSGAASFTGTLVVGTRLALLDLAFPGAVHAMTGTVTMTSGLPGKDAATSTVPDITLLGPSGSGADLGLFSVEQLRYALYGTPRFNYYLVDYAVESYVQVVGVIPFTVGGTSHDVVLAMDVRGDTPWVRLRADFRAVGPLHLSDVAGLLGADHLAVPFDVDVASPLALTELWAVLTPGAAEPVDSAGVLLETTGRWALVPGVVELEEIDVSFRVAQPLGADGGKLSGSVSGLVAVGASGTLELSATFETRTLAGGLREDDPPLSVREVYQQFVGQFTGVGTEHVPDIAVDDFTFGVTLPDAAAGTQLAYSGRLALSADWAITSQLVLSKVEFLLDHQDGKTTFRAWTAFFAGFVPVEVTAAYDPDPAKGWTFAGETGKGSPIPVGTLVAGLAETYGGLTLPAPLAGLTVENVGVRFSTGTPALYVTAEIALPVDTSTALDLVVTIDTAKRQFSGVFTVTAGAAAHTFTVRFADDPAARRFVAPYSHSDGDGPPPTLRELVAALSADAARYVPDGITVDLKDALFVFDKTGTASVYALGVDLALTVDLGRLPLVGERLAGGGGEFGVDPLRLLAVSGTLPAAEATALNALLPPSVAPLPAEADLAAGFTADAVLRLGGITQVLSLPAPGAGADQPAAPAAPAPAPGGPKATDDNVVWYKVQRTFGPVTFQRIGFSYQRPPGAEAASLAFLLDASLDVAGLAMTLDGLAVAVDLADPSAGPRFGLRGLGVSYRSGEVEVSGAFLAGSVTYQGRELPAYSGKAVLRTSAFSLGALGSYTQLPEGPSLFVYAFLDYPIGGPPVFFVEGLAAGFGYNRRFVAPDVAAVASFPLVAEAAGTRQPGELQAELQALQDHLPPSPGDFFLAVGVHFSSFRMIDSVLLLAVGFGHRFEVDLLGLSTLVLPSPDAAEAGVTPLAQVQLALRATLVPDDGYFALQAQLTQNSYLLSRDCKLTGGFAFQVWFGEEHTGDFVLSVGGYHPRYTKPAHYPAVPRLGFEWQVTPQLAMKGSSYFALTPSALMAGGSFSATWDDEDNGIRAWFSASMDFLIGWSPYHYQADFSARIGVAYTFTAFGTHTLTAEASAQVHLWGPEFSGRAAIDVGICSFTLSFGAGAPLAPDPIDWATFRKGFLPGSDDAVVTLVLQGGAAGTAGPADGAAGDLGSVNPLELVLRTDSAIPSRQAWRGPESGGQALDTTGAATVFGIAPMGLDHSRQPASAQRIEILRADGSRADDRFRYTPVAKNLPAALWGEHTQPAVTDPALVDGLLTGYTVRPLPPAEPDTAAYLARDVLRAATALDTQEDAYRWVPRQPFTPDGGDGPARRRVIADTVTAPAAADVRSALWAGFGDGAALDLGGFDAADFLVVPQVGVDS
jgi:hypothetical protein